MLGRVKLRGIRERVWVGRKREMIVSRKGRGEEAMLVRKKREREKERDDCDSECRKEGMLVRK